MQLFLTERHRSGAQLAQKLGCAPYAEADGARSWRGGEYAIVSMGGALARLAKPEVYDRDLASWERLDLLPIFPDVFRWSIERAGAADLLKDECSSASSVVVATDASREGEAMAMTALTLVGWRGLTYRLWRTDNSNRSLETGLSALRPIDQSAAYAQAATIRAEGDWVEGMNCSRIIAQKIKWFTPEGMTAQGPKAGIGRVQGMAFAAIAAADEHRETWRPVKAHGFSTRFRTAAGELRLIHVGLVPITDRGEAERERARLSVSRNVIIAVRTTLSKIAPPEPFDETLLQFTAHALLGWDLARTTRATGSLYEAGMVTHRHAEMRRYGPQTAEAAPGIVASLRVAGLWPHAAGKLLRKNLVAATSRAIWHGAIAPTGEIAGLEILPEDRRSDAMALFKIIVDRFACGHCDDASDETTAAECIDDQLRTHRGRSRRQAVAGWRALSDEESVRTWLNAQADADARPRPEREFAAWPDYEGVGDNAHLCGSVPIGVNGLLEAQAIESETILIGTPQPPRLTPMTLRALLEDASEAIGDEGLKSLPPGPHPIGATSTRADVISKLLERQVVYEDVDHSLRLSSAGRSLHSFLSKHCPELLDIGQAAAFEHIIRAVEAGEMAPAEARAAIQTRNLRIVRTLLAAPSFRGEVIERRSAKDPHGRRSSEKLKVAAGMPRGRSAAASGGGRDGAERPTSAEAPPADAVWLTVPFEKREDAKVLGARWASERRQWWVNPKNANWRMLRQKGFIKR